MATILTFQTNTDKETLTNRHVELKESKILNLASRRSEVVVNVSTKTVSLNFPEAWQPFVRHSEI